MNIVVVGSYGYTGKLICDKLEENGIIFTIAGRNKEKLNSLNEISNRSNQILVGDILEEDFVDGLIKEFDVVVNCAGPFTEESNLLLAKIACSGKIYLDICGEVGFIRNSWEKYNQRALETNSLIIHACAFESLIVDLVLQKKHNNEKITGIRTYYWFNQKRVSPGTKLTMKLSHYRSLLKISNGQWLVSDFIKDRYKLFWDQDPQYLLAIPYPLPEIAFSTWSFKPEFAESFLLISESEALFMGQNKPKSNSSKNLLDKLKKVKQKGPSKEERMNQLSKIIIEIHFEKKLTEKLTIESKDMYGTTAKSVMFALQRLNKNQNNWSGVISPAILFKGDETNTLEKLDCKIIHSNKLTIQAC